MAMRATEDLVETAKNAEFVARQEQVLLARIIEHWPLKNIPKELKQAFISDPAAIPWLAEQMKLYGQAKDDVRRLRIETDLLRVVGITTVSARTKPFVASEFYQTGTGLYVYDTFADRLDLSARQTVDSAPERPYVASLLKANAYDRDIRKELPEIHLSPLEDIAGLIEAQPNGKSGFLLNNGYANIFYVEGKNGEVFAVLVFWRSGHRYWYVDVWGLDELGWWDADRQVLCPGNAAL